MTAARTAPQPPTRKGRRLADRALDVLAVLGAISLVAVARAVPAAEISPGDVVTVDRGPDQLPLTHRVTEVTDRDPATGRTTFRMRGDANPSEDPGVYVETEVRRVVFSVPTGAAALQWFAHPAVLGGLTVLVSVLVAWSFWTKENDDDNDSPTHSSARHPAGVPDSSPPRHTA